jgi:tetratricopeptide (TPR) repeat protein
MTKSEKRRLDNIVPFPMEAVRRLGHQRVEKRRPNRLEQKGQLNLFRPAWGEVLEIPSEHPFEQALLYDEQGDDRAAEMYERAISRGDDVADAYCNLGIIRSREGDAVAAFDCFTKSLENDERHLESHYNLANLYFEQGDLNLAKLHYEIARSINDSFPSVYFNLGLVYAIQEDYGAAVDALRRYKDLAPEEGGQVNDLLLCLERSLHD